MKRSVQEIIELLVFGLIAVLIGTGVLWLVGWAIGGLGALFKLLAGLIWSLLRFVVPIAVVGAAVYALVRLLQGQRAPEASATAGGSGSAPSTSPGAQAPASSAPPPAQATSTKAVEPSAERAAVVEEAVAEGESEDETPAEEAERKKAGSARESGDDEDHDTASDDASPDEDDEDPRT